MDWAGVWWDRASIQYLRGATEGDIEHQAGGISQSNTRIQCDGASGGGIRFLGIQKFTVGTCCAKKCMLTKLLLASRTTK